MPVTSLAVLLPGLATAVCLALAVAVLLRRPLGLRQWAFSAGMVLFAAESAAAGKLLVGADPLQPLWLAIHQGLGCLLLVPWALFVAALAHRDAPAIPRTWRLALAATTVMAVGGAAIFAGADAFVVAIVPAPFEEARLVDAGRYGVVVQVLLTVAILATMEACLRGSRRASRTRAKYVLLGLGGVFLVRFYLLSQVLLFHTLEAVYLRTATATLAVGGLAMGVAVAGNHLRGAELAVSRGVVYRSVIVGVLGTYLFAVGALGWILTALEVPETTFWVSLVVFVSALALAAVLLSEAVRFRFKRFIALNFYASKYDYREQWMAFTRRMSSLLSVEALGLQLLEAVAEAVGSTRGALYLAAAEDGRYHLAGSLGIARPPDLLADGTPVLTRLAAERRPLVLENGEGRGMLGDALAAAFPDGALVVPLLWRDALTGLMLLGPERTGAAWSPEDLEFTTAVATQAAGSVVTARLSETAARAREFEAFDRLTSFVIHDLKNSVSALSMLSRNALKNFDDPEFQRDTVRTLSRTVDRMKGLLARLAAPGELVAAQAGPVDLAELVDDATGPLRADARVRLVTDLAELPPVEGDADALLKVVQNLVTNAAEAVAGEGTVTVTTRVENGMAVLAVADTGCGIPDDFLRTSLFAPFRSTKKGGWGIGLYQAREIVERHGGTISVTSTVGEGTTFFVRLPLAAAVASKGAA
jgi:putative PEP-CTERM system histidine kinase